ncbi:MAG: homoprotocatechuate degradation operon regulator HpaR [Hyphomicrobiales bacterium]|nr:homoprotocatechuate degradation operon regulator HpaR [Hyphomicrobiales bacterium]
MRKSTRQNAPISPTDRSLPIALLRAREKVMGPIREMLAKVGVTEQQWRVLRVLDEIGPSDASEIARRACLLMPSLTRIIQTLCENDLVTRKPDVADRRRQIIEITSTGRVLIAQNMAQSRQIASDLEGRFGRQNISQLLDLLNALDEM